MITSEQRQNSISNHNSHINANLNHKSHLKNENKIHCQQKYIDIIQQEKRYQQQENIIYIYDINDIQEILLAKQEIPIFLKLILNQKFQIYIEQKNHRRAIHQ
ncbi:hypothetical protein pb186bvf_011906 [Paramecium bursaria]